MIDEYEHRFNKTHKCQAVLKTLIELFDPGLFPSMDCTPLRLAMPDEFRSDNPVVSYRKFYASKPRLRYPVDKIPDLGYMIIALSHSRWSMDKKHKLKRSSGTAKKKKEKKLVSQDVTAASSTKQMGMFDMIA